MKQNLLFNQASALGKRLAMVLTMLLTVGIGQAWGADPTATLSFANKAQRTSFSTTKQVWEQNGVTFTNEKASSTNNIADYANPVRLYANSSVTVACSLGNMTKIVFDCNSSSYATAMKNSIGTVSGATVTVSSDKVTVTFTTAVESFAVAKLTAQVRIDSITVTYEEEATCTKIAPSLTYSPTTLEIGSTANPTLTDNTGDGTVTYSSDDSSVASVNATTGVVTANAAGTATITATIAANGDYCAGVATATIKVNKQSATIVLSEAGTENTVIGTFHKDESYTLPSSTEAKCGDKVLVGWSTEEIAETDTKPTYYSKGESVSLDAGENKFYAVFATKSETTGGTTTTPTTATLSFESTAQRTIFTTSQQVWTQNGITLTNDKGSSTSNVADYSNPARFYKSSNIIVEAPGNITKIVFNCVKDYVISITGATTSGYNVTVSLDGTSGTYTVNTLSAQVRMNSLEVTYNKTTTGGTTITYSDYTTQCSTETVVSFDLNGGSGTFDDVTLDGTTYVIPETEPTYNGYNFTGWKIQGGDNTVYKYGTTNSTINNITESITLVAQWSAIEYTITYHLNGGSGVENTTYTIESEDITLPTPEKQGLTFVGWYESADFIGDPVTVIKSGSTGNKEFWAKWEKSTPTFEWSDATCTVTIASESNVFPTLETTPVDLAGVKYSSSNTDVATIDANGNIILKSAGETTIRAYYEEDDTYAAAEDTYTLTVKESTNCRWEEVTINDIEYGDEVVVVMAHGLDLYALPYNKETATNSNPLAIKITLDDFKNTINNTCIWYITKEDVGSSFTLSPKTATDKYLTCNSSNNAVRINTASERNFTIENGFLKNTTYYTYLAISTTAAQKDWRHYASNNTTISSRAQTLKFYKRVCLPEGQYRVTWMVNGQEYTNGSPTTIVNDGSQVTTLPTIPDDYQLPGCTSKKFIGWTTDEILVETDDAPTMFTDAASSPTINTNQTFHALFADVEEGEEGWAQVTTTDDLIAGDIYTIGSSSTVGNGNVLGAQQSNNRAAVSWNSGNLVELTLGGSTDAWTLSDGTGYLYAASSSANQLKTQDTNNANGTWSINFSTNTPKGSAIIIAQGSNTRNVLRYNVNSSGNPLFSCYKDSEQMAAIYLFKKLPGTIFSGYVTQCCTPWEAPALTATTTSISSSYGTTQITCSGTTHGNVTYTSSNEYIAGVAVNSSGKVIVTGRNPGYVTITATWDGVDGSGNYCPAESSIDITVTGSFKITYEANHANATGSTAATTIAFPTGDGYVASNGFALAGHEFVKWNTQADGSGDSYNAGDAITLTNDITLYAIWQPNQYDITVNVIGGSVKLGSTTITSAQTFKDVVAHGQNFSFTDPTPEAAYSSNYTVTLNSGNANVEDNNLTVSNVQSDLNITITFVAKQTFTITYVIPTGGGTLVAGATTSIYEGGSITMPGIENNSIDPKYSCEELIGWTTQTTYENHQGQMPTPFYAIGSTMSNIIESTTLHAVYSRTGDGPSGTVELTCTDVSTWKSNVLSGNNNTYGTVTTRTAADGSVWKTNGQIQNAGGIDLKENYYIQIPTLPGPATSITMKVSQGNIGSGEDACTDNVASATSRAFYFRSADNGSNLFTSETTSSRSRTINITEGNYTTGYIINGEGTSHVHAITVAYGSPNIISTSLNCSNDIDEFTITYNTNYGSAIGQIPTGTVVNGACDNSGEPIRFEDLPNGEYTICNSLTATQYKLVGWNSQANGNGGLSYEPGDVITMVPQSDITLYAQWVPEVIMLDNKDRTITYQETVGEAITLPAGAYTCDGKYTFVGWTTDNVDSWNQKISKPTLVAELDGNDETLFVPTEPTVVYAVYKLETTANSKAFYLKSNNNYYAQKHNTYVLKGTSDIADATRLYRQQINVESPNNYWLYYLDDEQQKRFVYINTANLGELFAPSIGDGETTPEDTEGWEFVSVTGGYKLKALGTYGNSVGIVTHYMYTNESGRMGSNTAGSVYTIETATEINYYAYPTCSDEITITFETRGGTLIPNDHPYVLTKKEGDVITLPGCEYAGLDFIGWVDEPIEPTEIIANPEDIYEAEEEYVVGNQNIVLYAYYSQTPESAEYDGNSDGEWKIYAFADGEYHFAVAPDSEEGDMSTVTICDKSTTWTFTNVAENQYYIQDEEGRYVGVRPAIENKNDLRFTDEPVIWTIENKGSDLYRLTCETNTDRVMLYDNGRIRYSSHTQEENPEYFYVTIGGCFNPIYTTDPARLQAVSVYGTVQITSTLGQTVKAMDKLTLVVRHAEPESYIRFSSPNVTFYDESGNVITTALVESQKQQIPLVVAYTPDVADNSIARPAITVTAKTLNQSTGTYVETNYTVNGRISARRLPADFAIVAKVGNLWYALPSQGLNSTDALVGYPVEVDNQNDPTAVTAVPENADWSLRQVYAASHSDAQKDRFKLNGANIMFENNATSSLLLSASRTENYLLTDANYTSYQQADNQGLYEWTPATNDLETYTLTNANPASGRDIKLSMNITNIFGVHKQNVATTELRFLPIQNRYTQASLQVVEWRKNSIVVMYTGDPAQTATLAIDGTTAIGSAILNEVNKDVAIYELPASGLMNYATKRLLITIGTSKKWLTVPYIISGEKTDAEVLTSTSTTKAVAAVSDVVVLNGATFTAGGTKTNKYTFRNITVYGGGKLVVPASATEGLGIYSLVMRLGTVKDGTYTNSYPQLVMNGKYSNTSGIYLDYITTYERYYALSVPYTVKTKEIKYPAEIYGDNLKSGNKASFALQYYDGAARATGATGWKDFDESGAEPTLTKYQGYTFWGAPRKVSVNGGDAQRPKFGIHRIPLTGESADDLLTAETNAKTIGITAHPAERPNDMGWNFLGNPYLAQYGGLSASDENIQVGLLEKEMVDDKWTGAWKHTGNLRYITTTTDGQNYTTEEVDKATFSPFNTFFIQVAKEGVLEFAAASRAQSLPARQYAAQQEAAKEITTGILLTGNDQTDRTGLLIADNFTEEYEFNADLSKFENSGINLYTIGKTGNLAYMAINQALAEQPIPVGYTVPAEGLYTIAFDEDRYNATDISALYLIDYDSNEKTNLLHTDYSFVTAAGTNNQRFALQVAFAPENATNVEWVGDATVQVGMEGNTLMLNNLPTDAAMHVFDALGRLMYHAPTVPTEMQLTLPTGYYLVRIADKQNAVVIKTVIP